MKKRSFLLIPAFASLLAGCAVNLDFTAGKDLSPNITKGTLGDFSLVAPTTGAVVHDLPTFSWTESANALNYTLEVCSTDTFDPSSKSVVYAKETNIGSTSFKLSSTLTKKNITYYWRVTAVNEYNTKSVGKEKQSAVSTFRYEIDSVGEVDIGVGEKSDWALHEVGSYADISIDETDFFGTGDKDSLKITFEKENTNQGPGHEKSDGWLSIQKSAELDLFDCNAFFCNFYYSGHDSTILIRVIDQDGELWYKQVKFTMDTRQLILLKFDDFILRTGDTVVQNQTFDHEHIQGIEITFEKTFGDGCCIVGGIKAVNSEDYEDLFIEHLKFDCVPEDEWINESYNFKKTISEDKSELVLEYSNELGFNGNTVTMSGVGYGFAKIPVERYFSEGNAVRVKIRYTGYAGKTNATIRLYEPDRDRWSYEHPYSVLTAGEYSEITIPFMGFNQSSIVEGKRQFYYISQIQFGLNTCYGAGTLSFKDFEIITLPDMSKNPREVGLDGVIENFDNYVYRGEAYKQWEIRSSNKDEGIFLLNEERYHDGVNKLGGKFTYKSDMEMATYDIYTDVKAEGLTALKFWIKDASVPKTDNPHFSNFTGEDVAAEVTFQIYLADGRVFQYVIDHAPRIWTEYVIPFTKFTQTDGPNNGKPVLSQNVKNFAFGLKYLYYYKSGGVDVHYPLYTQNNPVYMDEIMFSDYAGTVVQKTDLGKVIHPDSSKVSLVDNFEYSSNDELTTNWTLIKNPENGSVELADEVSVATDAGSHSMKLNYSKGKDSAAYATFPQIGSDVTAKAVQLDIKGDGSANIYVNLYFFGYNNTLYQYRVTLANFSSSWNRCVFGLDSSVFAPQNGGGVLNRDSIRLLQKITFGVAGSGSGAGAVYVDNIKFVVNKPGGGEYSFGVNTKTPIVED